MSIQRGIDGTEPVRSQPVEAPAGPQERRRALRSSSLGTGTLACPSCDAPVALADGPRAPADPLGCPVCEHAGAVRDFLSLASPSRPARVEVRVLRGGRRPAARSV